MSGNFGGDATQYLRFEETAKENCTVALMDNSAPKFIFTVDYNCYDGTKVPETLADMELSSSELDWTTGDSFGVTIDNTQYCP